MFRFLKKGSDSLLGLHFALSLIALFCFIINLFNLVFAVLPHSAVQLLRYCKIKELYNIFISSVFKILLALEMTPIFWDILFCISFECVV